jgi:hypothetical protein
MKWEKIFVIGFNKTATSTFHKIFCDIGLRSQHSPKKWDTDTYDCFSDNGNLQDAEFLKEKYPKSLFILNTRSLEKWLLSRSKHCAPDEFGNFKSWGWPPSASLFVEWILDRHYHFNKILTLFKDCPDRLVIISIDRPNWQKFLAKVIGFQFERKIFENTTRKSKNYEQIIDSINKSFEILKIKNIERNHEFIDHDMTKIYRKNIVQI